MHAFIIFKGKHISCHSKLNTCIIPCIHYIYLNLNTYLMPFQGKCLLMPFKVRHMPYTVIAKVNVYIQTSCQDILHMMTCLTIFQCLPCGWLCRRKRYSHTSTLRYTSTYSTLPGTRWFKYFACLYQFQSDHAHLVATNKKCKLLISIRVG